MVEKRASLYLQWVAAMLLTVGAATVAPGDDATALPPDAAVIPANGGLVASFRVADLWEHALLRPVRDKLKKEVAELATEIEKNLGAPPETIERLTVVVVGFNGGGEVVLVRLRRPFDRARVTALAGKDAKEETYRGRSLFVGGGRQDAVALLDDRTYVVGRADPIRGLLDRPAKSKDGPLTPAARLLGEKHTFVFGANVPAIAEQVKDELPSQVEAIRPLLEAKTGAVAADLDEEAKGEVRLTFADAAAAKKGEKAARDGLTLARAGLIALRFAVAKEKAFLPLIDQADAAIKTAEVRSDQASVTAMLRVRVDPDKVIPSVVALIQKQRGEVRRQQSTNNLRQLAIAMHNFHGTYNRFPAAMICDRRGKPLLSWRVQLLPYIDQKALYDEFHLDEPWDSEHNKKFLDRMPRVFAAQGEEKSNRTHYQVFTGKDTCFEGKKGIPINEITDGTSNTLLIVEAATAVPWTKPEDLPFDADKPLPKLGGVQPGGFNAAFADGSVRFLKADIKESTLRLMIQRNDGQPLPGDF
jgi:prepilin-type processing-associated H-X9-DG protein